MERGETHRIAEIISLIGVLQFHNEAVDFATKFEKLEKPSSLPIVRARLNSTSCFDLTTDYSYLSVELRRR
jgi:hypothetical protein